MSTTNAVLEPKFQEHLAMLKATEAVKTPEQENIARATWYSGALAVQEMATAAFSALDTEIMEQAMVTVPGEEEE